LSSVETIDFDRDCLQTRRLIGLQDDSCVQRRARTYMYVRTWGSGEIKEYQDRSQVIVWQLTHLYEQSKRLHKHHV
jgi:hypothetical protein